MISEELLYKNHFDDKNIINSRLEVYADDFIARITAGNTGGRFQDVLDKLVISYPAFTGNITNVDTALNLQKGQTMTVEGAHKLFKVTMSFQEPFIAIALGGKATPAYQAFYPKKVTEYSKCPQRDMAMLTTRVNAAALLFAAPLGATLSALLEGFKVQWKKAKDLQVGTKGDVSTKRTNRGSTRLTFEKDLCFGLSAVGKICPGDAVAAATYVNFSLLYSIPHNKKVTKSGSIDIGGKELVTNLMFNAGDIIYAKNTSDNAIIRVYIVEEETDMPTLYADLHPNKSFNIAAELLGDLAGTMLMIMNLSTVNKASYIVEYKV